jgi:hypothetical protein
MSRATSQRAHHVTCVQGQQPRRCLGLERTRCRASSRTLPPAPCPHIASFPTASCRVAALTPPKSAGQLGLGDTESHAGNSRHVLPAPALPLALALHAAAGHLVTRVEQFLKTSTCLKGKRSLRWLADCAFTQPSQASCCPTYFAIQFKSSSNPVQIQFTFVQDAQRCRLTQRPALRLRLCKGRHARVAHQQLVSASR